MNLFPVTIQKALSNIEAAFGDLDKAVEYHAEKAATATTDANRLRALADAAEEVAAENTTAAARAQRVKLRLSDLLA